MKATIAAVLLTLLSAGAALAHPHFNKTVSVKLPSGVEAVVTYNTTPSNEIHATKAARGTFVTPRRPMLKLSAELKAGTVTIPAGEQALTAAGGGECNNPLSRTQQNFTLQVIDPALLGGSGHYAAELGRLVRHVRSSRPRPGASAVRLPGERGMAALRAARRDGVPVEDGMLGKLGELAAKVGLPPLR